MQFARGTIADHNDFTTLPEVPPPRSRARRRGPGFRFRPPGRAQWRRARSRRSISAIDVERRSTRMLADSGIEFTEVPPRITPTLKVVFGEAGTGVCANDCTARDEHDDGIGRAEIAPGVSAGAAHDHLETAAAQGFSHDGVRARAVQHQAVVRSGPSNVVRRKRDACPAGRLRLLPLHCR